MTADPVLDRWRAERLYRRFVLQEGATVWIGYERVRVDGPVACELAEDLQEVTEAFRDVSRRQDSTGRAILDACADLDVRLVLTGAEELVLEGDDHLSSETAVRLRWLLNEYRAAVTNRIRVADELYRELPVHGWETSTA